jgi:hypothetical protein
METVIPVPVPTSADLRKMLFELVDKMVTCTESTVAPDAGGGNIAIYQGRDGMPLAMLVADLTFAASASAALAMMPPRLVEEAKKEGALPASLTEVFHEVANILSALLNSPNTPHVVLRRIVTSAAELEDEERAMLTAPRRLLQNVEIKGFGTGYCAFVCAA